MSAGTRIIFSDKGPTWMPKAQSLKLYHFSPPVPMPPVQETHDWIRDTSKGQDFYPSLTTQDKPEPQNSNSQSAKKT
jgi:hypothetical protein